MAGTSCGRERGRRKEGWTDGSQLGDGGRWLQLQLVFQLCGPRVTAPTRARWSVGRSVTHHCDPQLLEA